MFLNILPVTSFLVLSVLLCSGDYLVEKKIAPEFIRGNFVSGIFGALILLWGVLLFYSNLNYFIYQAFNAPITVLLRLMTVLYFIASGVVIAFKCIGKFFFPKYRKPVDEEKYNRLLKIATSSKQTLAKIGTLFIAFYALNYLLM